MKIELIYVEWDGGEVAVPYLPEDLPILQAEMEHFRAGAREVWIEIDGRRQGEPDRSLQNRQAPHIVHISPPTHLP